MATPSGVRGRELSCKAATLVAQSRVPSKRTATYAWATSEVASPYPMLPTNQPGMGANP